MKTKILRIVIGIASVMIYNPTFCQHDKWIQDSQILQQQNMDRTLGAQAAKEAYEGSGGGGGGAALLFGGAALIVPSYCTNMHYKDETGNTLNKKGLGCGIDLESYTGKYVAFGGSIKYNSPKYFGFAPQEGGYLSGKIDLGLGVPTKSDMFGGLYVGGSVGAGWIRISEADGALSYGLWAFLGGDNIGIKISYDIFKYKDVIPDDLFTGLINRYSYSTQYKLYLGHYLTIGYCQLNSTIDEFKGNISFITLGICYRG